jgi:hypothetical protein
MNKVIRDGKVAVLVSPGFGAGWSTWGSEHRDWALFAPELVAWVEGGKKEDIDEIVELALGGAHFYTGGSHDLVIEWVEQGQQFIIEEHDGSETLTLVGELPVIQA